MIMFALFIALSPAFMYQSMSIVYVSAADKGEASIELDDHRPSVQAVHPLVSDAKPSNRKLRSDGVATWSVDEVCDWLSRQGLGKYTGIFRRNEMDGRELIQLNHQVLEKELGIGKSIHANLIQANPIYTCMRSQDIAEFRES